MTRISQYSDPTDTGFLVGREEELRILRRELTAPTPKAIWISAPGGFGKVSLAIMFCMLNKASFPAGCYMVSVAETLSDAAREIRPSGKPSLIILSNVHLRPVILDEFLSVRRDHPNARIVVTSRSAQPYLPADFHLQLEGLRRTEFGKLMEKNGASVGSQNLTELWATAWGRPATGVVMAHMLKGGTTAEWLIGTFGGTGRSFWSGIADPNGARIPEGSPEHRRVLSDVILVSDKFLRALHQNPRLLYELTPRGFEELVAELLAKLGYDVSLTPSSKDGGKDLYAATRNDLGTFMYLVECKRYAPDHPVGVGLVRELHGVVQAERATAGIIATTSFFTRDAQEFQKQIEFQVSLQDYLGIRRWIENALRARATEQPLAADGASRRR